MKIIILILVSLLYSTDSFSLMDLQVKKDSARTSKSGWTSRSPVVSIGLGYNNPVADTLRPVQANSPYELGYLKGNRPVYVKLEFMLNEKLGFGATLNYLDLYYDLNYYDAATQHGFVAQYRYSKLSFNARLNYHFFYRKFIDLYLGVGAGFKEERFDRSVINRGMRGFECTLGARYLVKGVVGIYLEAGIAQSIIQGGISLNFMGFRK